MPVSVPDRYASLIEALAAIAAEPAEQARLLASLTRVASELRRGAAVEMLDVEELAREGMVPETGFLITRIEELLDELVADQTGIAFTEHALHHDLRWQLARRLAREALEQLGERAPRSRINNRFGCSSCTARRRELTSVDDYGRTVAPVGRTGRPR